MKDMSVRLLQGIVDKFLGVDNRKILNGETEPDSTNGDIAAAMRTIVDQLKMEAFDTEKGLVYYQRLRDSTTYQQYKQVAARLRGFDPSLLSSKAEKLAFWINLYNSLVVDAVIAFGIKKSVWEGGKGFFRQIAYEVGGLRYSADDIEHGILRGNRHNPVIPLPQFTTDDPRNRHAIVPMEARVHFTLVCASRSCPLITVYHASDIEKELEMATNSFVNGGSIIIDTDKGRISLSRIFKLFQADFGGRRGVIELILRYLNEGPDKDFLLENMSKVRITYQKYDWSLNHL